MTHDIDTIKFGIALELGLPEDGWFEEEGNLWAIYDKRIDAYHTVKIIDGQASILTL